MFLTLFDRFTKLEIEDIKFAEFLREFDKNLRLIKRNEKGLLFDEIDKEASTKDKQVIADKLDLLENMMLEFLHINKTNSLGSIESFVAENLNMNVEDILEDLDFYIESLNDLLDNTVRLDSKLRNEENRPSLLAMIVYSYKEDKDLDEWMVEYAKKNSMYFKDQKKNYFHMKKDFEKYISKAGKKSA